MRVLAWKKAFDGRLIGAGDPSSAFCEGDAPGLLALHGFANTPAEVAPLVELARRLGRRGHAPLLPGHGTTASELQRTGWADWAHASESALDVIAPAGSDGVPGGGECAVVAGLSLGSLLALHLAASRPDRVAGLVVLSCAAWLPPAWPGIPLRLLGGVYRRSWDLYAPKGGSDIRDPEARAAALTYDLNPLGAAIEVERAGRVIRRVLGRVRCPVLIIHGARDRVCPPANLGRLARALGSTDIEAVLLPRSAHIVTLDFDREELAARITAFMDRVAPIAAATPAAGRATAMARGVQVP